jgi:hypothetical protein
MPDRRSSVTLIGYIQQAAHFQAQKLFCPFTENAQTLLTISFLGSLQRW